VAIPLENSFEKMRILQLIPTLGTGGAQHFVFELSNELVARGHQVVILTLFDTPEDNPLRRGLDKRVQLCSLNKNKGFDPRIFYSVWRFISRNGFDVVHGHVGAIKYMTFASFFCRKVRFVATIHSEARREAGKNIDRWSRKLMFRFRSCTPVCVSEESELSFEAFYSRPATLIANGVSDYQHKKDIVLRDNAAQTVFLHVASCQRVKNQELLLKAFSRLLEDGHDAKLVWIGSNTSFHDLYDSLAPLMQKNVEYLGVREDVRDYMAAADALCLSSKMEGMPITIIEAFSVGRPVLSTPVGGCLNMIKQGENGMLSEDLSVEAYYRMLSAFAALPETERKQLSNHARESFLDSYQIGKCAVDYLKLYGNGYQE